MKQLLLLLALLLTVNANAEGIKLLSYNGKTATDRDYTAAEVNKAWASKLPVCIKKNAKILGVNQAFLNMKLGYRDCSNGKTAQAFARKNGFSVVVFKAQHLPQAMYNQIVLGK